MAVTFPAKPALQKQPVGTLTPVLPSGQSTGVQTPAKKGATVVAETVPLNPALQVQPAGTLSPKLLIGHATGVTDPVK